MKGFYELIIKFALLFIGAFLFVFCLVFCLVFTGMVLFLTIKYNNCAINNDMIIEIINTSANGALISAFVVITIVFIGLIVAS